MKFLSAALLMATSTVASCYAMAATPATAMHNVVLVHGSFADGSGWRGVTEILEKDGFHVSVVQEPETSLDDDVKAVQRTLALQDGPAVLVGHSYGGVVITQAGTDPKVASLVYVAGIAPDAGEAAGEFLAKVAGVSLALTRAAAGLVCPGPGSVLPSLAPHRAHRPPALRDYSRVTEPRRARARTLARL